MSTPVVEQGGEAILDFGAIFARLMAKRWWVIGSVVLSTAAFMAAAFLMTPIYRAAVLLAPAALNQSGEGLAGALGQLGGLASIAGINLGGKGGPDTEEALAVLRSRQFTERFINDRKLMPKLFARKWDSATGTWKGTPPTPAKAYRYFNERVRSVVQDKRTGLITLQIDWRDRNEAAAWANELADRLNEEMRQRATANSEASLGYLEKEMQTTSTVPTREAIGRLIETQVKQRMLANVTREYAFRVVDRAMPPDEDDPVKPKKVVMLVAGIVVGLVLAVVAILASGWRSLYTVVRAPS
jgi:uncharacterized protein involved in exopolysaccharide biosynthesis